MDVFMTNDRPRHSSLPSRSTSTLQGSRVVSVATIAGSAYDISLLSTDFVPTTTEARVLEATMTEQRIEISLMNSEVSVLRRRTSKLCARIGEIERNVRLHEALLSPSRRLPPELLGEVFLHCLSKQAMVIASPDVAPLLLLQVCRRWRQVACNTPRLWMKLNLSRGFSLDPATIVPLWLVHSRVLPLDIRINAQEWEYDFDPKFVERNLSRLLAKSIHRCRSFAGSVSSLAIEELFQHDIIFPRLETLELWLPERNHFSSTGAVPHIGNLQTPCIRSIVLNDTGFITNGLRYPLPTLRLLQLTGQEEYGLLSHSSCLDFIALCPNIQSCTLTLSKSPGSSLHSPVVLESLRHLHLIFKFSPHDPVPFLKALQTPHIERLTLQNHGGVSPVPHIRRVLHLLLSVRPHTIKELHLSSLFVPTSDWVPSLRELTMLESLTIVGDSLDESFFEALASEGPYSTWSCPRLTSLTLHHVTGLLGLSGDRLVGFIRSRAQSRAGYARYGELMDSFVSLQSVSLMLCHLEHRHVLELQEIQRQSGGSLLLHGLGNPE